MSTTQLPTIRIEPDGSVGIDGLQCGDSALRDLLQGHEPEAWPDLVCRALAVGARGLLTMGLGVNIAELEERFRRSLEEVTSESEARVGDELEAARKAFADHLDPEVRSSLMGQTLDRFGAAGAGLMERLNPDLAGSDTARFLAELKALLGPAGELEARLRATLDPNVDGSALGTLAATFEERFRDLRDLIAREEGRADEAERGTAKGVDFEEVVEARLRELAGGAAGCLVERTSRTPGSLGPSSIVGDFVVEFPTGSRVVIEAKNTGTLTLHGKGGILAELDRARQNRDAEVAICVSACDAYPAEVGVFGVYGNRILVVDEGDGVMLAVAMRWCQAMLALTSERGPEIDAALVLEGLNRIRGMAQHFSTTKRTLTDVRRSVDGVRTQIEEMRSELLQMVEDLLRHLEGAAAPAPPLQVA